MCRAGIVMVCRSSCRLRKISAERLAMSKADIRKLARARGKIYLDSARRVRGWACWATGALLHADRSMKRKKCVNWENSSPPAHRKKKPVWCARVSLHWLSGSRVRDHTDFGPCEVSVKIRGLFPSIRCMERFCDLDHNALDTTGQSSHRGSSQVHVPTRYDSRVN
jgi:hypothetical protein